MRILAALLWSVGGARWRQPRLTRDAEVFVYCLHRFLHLRKPVDVYKWIHRQHHLFFFPSAFAAQAIHPVEAMMFAATSLLATVFLFPLSVATQYTCGVLLLTWSILAHDSQFVLDQVRGTS
jgi:lathosterol oxidase